jgi:uncharacterized protein (DUF2345 family)
MQAQNDLIEIAAKGLVNIMSAHAHIDWAAAKRIVLCTAGGASITIEGGNIIIECPGTITIRASVKSFLGPQGTRYPMPQMPKSVCVECLKNAAASGSPLAKLS